MPNILQPLREFLLEADGPGAVLQKEFGAAWSNEVFKAVTTKYVDCLFDPVLSAYSNDSYSAFLRYTANLSGMKKTEDSLRRYNKSKRSTFMLFGAASSAAAVAGDDKEARDEARIRSQMVLDVETLGKNARSLGNVIDVDGSEEFKELLSIASQG